MFTGIIEACGRIESITGTHGDFRLHVVSDAMDFSDLNVGDSIAVSGVCLTAVQAQGNGFLADVSNETMQCTSLGTCEAGDEVNLEKALQARSRLGGHIVSGHVDGLAVVTGLVPAGENMILRFSVPDELAHYIARKGSVCLDGVSLTVNEVSGSGFSVNIIPHTREKTVIRNYRIGSRVNIEIDVIARYLERMLQMIETGTASVATEAGITLDKLRKTGFVK